MPAYPGLGMGLYVVSEIVKQHGGRIWVENAKGRGSAFRFSHPAAPTAAGRPRLRPVAVRTDAPPTAAASPAPPARG